VQFPQRSALLHRGSKAEAVVRAGVPNGGLSTQARERRRVVDVSRLAVDRSIRPDQWPSPLCCGHCGRMKRTGPDGKYLPRAACLLFSLVVFAASEHGETTVTVACAGARRFGWLSE